jgi:hypothetical protein
VIVATIENITRTPQRVRVQGYTVARSLDDGTLQIDMLADHLVTVGALEKRTVGAQTTYAQTDDKYVALGIRERSGYKYLGWFWRVIDGNGRVCAVASSTPTHDRLGWQQPVEPQK